MVVNFVVLVAMAVFMFVFLGAALMLVWVIGVGLPMWIATLMAGKRRSTDLTKEPDRKVKQLARIHEESTHSLDHRELQWFVDWHKAWRHDESLAVAPTL